LRLDGIVPFTVKGISGKIEGCQFFIRDLDASRIDVAIFDSCHG